MERLRVCIISQQFGEVLSGPGLYTRNLVSGLLERGYAVTLVAPTGALVSCPRGLEIVDVGARSFTKKRGGWIILSLAFARCLKQLVKDKTFDVFHFSDAKEAFFSVGLKGPIIGNVNDPYLADKTCKPNFYWKNYPVDWLARWFYFNLMFGVERYALKRLDMNICNSKFTKAIVSERYQIVKKRLALCYKSIDTEAYADTRHVSSGRGNQTVLFVGGGNAQRKGFASFLKAADIVSRKSPGVQYIVVGRGKAIPILLKKYHSERVASCLKHIEHVPNNEMKELYSRADVFVMPSLIEAFGVVYLESMACGTPVIGTTRGGVAELITEGENGLLVTPGDADDLARQIMRLLTDNELKNMLVENGKRTVQNFSARKMLNETLQIYQQVIDAGDQKSRGRL